jgi:precorrin-2 dehydrogenase / sirohydrochlorin ferrochelatase
VSEPHYFACLDLRGRRCLVIGTGSMAEEKIAGLQASGAVVETAGEYEPELLDGIWLVIVANGDGERVYRDASARNVFCNVADVPELCSFILPAIHRRGPIALAVSTGGASPALAQRLRDDFGSQIGEEHERLAGELRELRPWVRENLETYEERRDFFRDAVAKALG